MASRLLNVVRIAVQNTSSRSFSAGHGDVPATHKRWKLLSILMALPAIGLLYINTERMEKDHEAHWERPEFIPYSHLRTRSKKFPWGDGNKSAFHDPKVNALPDGYEEEEE